MSQLNFDQVVTRGGDWGDSTLYSGERFGKDDPVFGVLGDMDELNALLGMAKHPLPAARRADVEVVQTMLWELMSLVATLDHSLDGRFDPAARTAWLEEDIARLLAVTTIPEAFVLPGASTASAVVDLARTVCRRAERELVALIRERGRVELAACQVCLNRLSDWLFVLARHVEQLG